MKKRIEYIDIAKGILILLVALRHVLNFANLETSVAAYTVVCAFIHTFLMPAFFMISGMLYNNEKLKGMKWGQFIGKRFRSLIVPYCFFEIFAILYIELVLHRGTYIERIIKFVTFKCNVGADWFLPAMFVAQIIYLIYAKYPHKIVWPVIAVCSFCCMWVIPNQIYLNTISQGLVGFGLMYLGHNLKRVILFTTDSRIKNIGITCGYFLLTCIFAYVEYFYAAFDLYGVYINHPLIMAAGGFCGFCFILNLSKGINLKPLRWFGENSLVIMGTHQLVLYTIPHSASILWVLGSFVLIIVIEIPVILLTNRFCPFLIGKAK